MTPGLLIAFAGFAAVASITPGPNNAMLLASGVNFGFRRTLPHITGITIGAAVMLLLVGVGLGQVFIRWPSLQIGLRYLGALYLLWLAWQIARAGSVADGDVGGRPFTFWQAASFQWVNPKAWILVVGAVTAYAPAEGYAVNVVVLAAVLALVNAPIVALWACGGQALRPLLQNQARLRWFNRAMAALLVGSVAVILAE